MFEMMFYLFRQAIENATDKKEKHVSMCDKQVHYENIQMLERIDVWTLLIEKVRQLMAK